MVGNSLIQGDHCSPHGPCLLSPGSCVISVLAFSLEGKRTPNPLCHRHLEKPNDFSLISVFSIDQGKTRAETGTPEAGLGTFDEYRLSMIVAGESLSPRGPPARSTTGRRQEPAAGCRHSCPLVKILESGQIFQRGQNKKGLSSDRPFGPAIGANGAAVCGRLQHRSCGWMIVQANGLGTEAPCQAPPAARFRL